MVIVLDMITNKFLVPLTAVGAGCSADVVLVTRRPQRRFLR